MALIFIFLVVFVGVLLVLKGFTNELTIGKKKFTLSVDLSRDTDKVDFDVTRL